jgi:hypothetical protein
MRNGAARGRRRPRPSRVFQQRRAVVPRHRRRALVTLSPFSADIGMQVTSSMPSCAAKLAVVVRRSRRRRLVVADQVHLVDREHDVADAEQRHDVAVPARLRQHALARVDQDDGEVGGRGAGRHVARVLLVARRVGDDELALVGREEAVGDVDGDALLALGLRPSTSSAKSMSSPCVPCFGCRLERASWSSNISLRVVQQPADQRRLAVVDAAAGDEAQQALVLVLRREVRSPSFASASSAERRRRIIRSSPPASSSPSTRPRRGRSRGPGARRWRQQHLGDDLLQRVGVALDRAGQRIAAERAEAHRRICRRLAVAQRQRSSSTMISVPSRSTTGRSLAK